VSDDLRDYIEKWLFRAGEDISVIDRLMESDPNAYASSICFHAQQAVEKYLKAFLAYKQMDFPRTHDVDYLLRECQRRTCGFLEGIDLKSLTDFGVSVRYPDDFYVPDPSETAYYAQVAKKVEKAVLEQIRLA